MLKLYIENGLSWNQYPTLKIAVDTLPESSIVGFTPILDYVSATQLEAEQAIEDIDNYCFSLSSYDYKTVRDCIKNIAIIYSISNSITAKHNIGTGDEIKTAVPNIDDRDTNSYAYLDKMSVVRRIRANYVESYVWSRCKHIDVVVNADPLVTVNMPLLILDALTITTATSGEMEGNLLQLYKDFGLQGFAGGDDVLGIEDFLQSTVGTRYETMGLRTHPLFINIVPDGFTDINEFATHLYNTIHYGRYVVTE